MCLAAAAPDPVAQSVGSMQLDGSRQARGGPRKAVQRACSQCTHSDYSALLACMQRLAWVAIDVAHGAGWSSTHSLMATSRAARESLSALFPHFLARLPLRLLVRCADSGVLQLDVPRGAWALLGQPGQQARRRARAVLACGERLVAVTGGGELHLLDEARGLWQTLSAEAPGPGRKTWSWTAASCGGRPYLIEAGAGGTCVRRVDLDAKGSEQLYCGELSDQRLDISELKPVAVENVIYWFARDHASDALLAFSFDTETRRAALVGSLRDRRPGRLYCDHLEAVAVAGCVYVVAHCDDCGDASEPGCTSSVLAWRLRAETGRWEELPPAPTARTHFSAAGLGGRLYLVGGEGTRSPGVLATVERFDPSRGVWEALPSMPSARSGAAVVARRGRLCVLGGAGDVYGDGGDAPEPSRTVECFDPQSGIWTRLPQVPEAVPSLDLSHLQPVVVAG